MFSYTYEIPINQTYHQKRMERKQNDKTAKEKQEIEKKRGNYKYYFIKSVL